MKKLALACLLVSFVCGCAASGPKPDGDASVQKTRRVPHNFEDVWPAALETVSDQGWAIAVADKESGRIRTEFTTVEFDEIHKYSQCPMGMNTQIMRGRMLIEVSIVKQSAYECSLGIAARFDGWDEGEKKAWLNCDTTGELEKTIFEGIDRRISRR